MTDKKMKKLKFSMIAAAGFAAIAFAPASAWAISDAAECKSEVKSVVRDLLKANVSADDLGKIDAAIVAAEADCGAENFAGAEAKIAEARAMIGSASQN